MKKNHTLAVVIAFCLVAGSAWSAEIVAEKKEQGADTIIYCSPTSSERITRAYITIFQTSAGMPQVVREEMEVSADGNKASYVLTGRHQKIDGRCRMLVDSDATPAGVTPLADNSDRILNQEFAFVSP
ncbi:MAG: hypothetical protein HGA96_08100 [Desulfobulbaceae bacterium]|nr:hypothetical protein [Desulfobulbaceae bacterium]